MKNELIVEISKLTVQLKEFNWEDCFSPYIHRVALDILQGQLNISRLKVKTEIRLKEAQKASATPTYTDGG